jgi:two-component system NtrC family response regulator
LLPLFAVKRQRVLIVDGDPLERSRLGGELVERGFDATEAGSAGEAMAALARQAPDACLVDDAGLPEGGAALVSAIRGQGSDAALVVCCNPDGLDGALAAMRRGADGYLVRPLNADQAAVVLDRALAKQHLLRESADLRARARDRSTLVGAAPELQVVHEVIRRAAPTKATVLVLGENGTGKRLVAQALHEASPRRDRPFVDVNCAALSESLLESMLFGHEKGAFPGAAARAEGRLETANGGTLFLNEVSSLSPTCQVRLLRVLQQGEFERVGGAETLRADVRVVASSQRDLAERVQAGHFRDDLYYRLNVVTVVLPPLRVRKGDIPALADHFLRIHSRAAGKGVRGITPGALSALFAYDWPGNVRELENVVERAVRSAQGAEIGAEDLPPVLRGARPEERTASALIPGATLFEIEREAILRTLDVAGGSTARAAEVLGISVRKIQYRLKEYRSGHPGAGHPTHALDALGLDRRG